MEKVEKNYCEAVRESAMHQGDAVTLAAMQRATDDFIGALIAKPKKEKNDNQMPSA